MKHVLLIGGTRNMGYYLARDLFEAGHRVTLLNRGLSTDDLPDGIARLRADRTDPEQMKRALLAKSFDVVVDFVLFRGVEAETIVELLRDNVGHYVFISSGQVYLVREGIDRPFREEDYDGRLMPAPKDITYAYEEWLYGMGKRECEDTLATAWEETGFPYTSLRLPMVNSPRDPLNRLYNYYLRLKDGGPILAPRTPNHPLNHVYAGDVVRAVESLIERGEGQGHVYNIAQDETLPLEDFLGIMADIMNVPAPEVVRFPRSELDANGFLPDCSPFSDRWMSALDNARSKTELGLRYTPLADYLPSIIAHYRDSPPQPPASYRRRRAEIGMAKSSN